VSTTAASGTATPLSRPAGATAGRSSPGTGTVGGGPTTSLLSDRYDERVEAAYY